MLEVKTLGGFQILQDGKPISLGKQSGSNIIKLFMLLLANQKNGISRRELMKGMFYDQEADSDPGANLRVTVYRLRQALKKYGIPEGDEDCILVEGGMYTWNPNIPVQVDVDEFEKASVSALKEEDGEKALPLCLDALQIYNGEYLNFFSTEEWVNCRQIELTKLYHKVFEKAFQALFEAHEYRKALTISERAVILFPYEEYQANMIDCLMVTGQNKEAMKLYEQTSDFYFREMGMDPSEKMKERFRRLGDHVQSTHTSLESIKDGLNEKDDANGPYYCSLPSFIDNYRFVSRLLERTGQSAYIVVAMLDEEKKKNQIHADNLMESIRKSIRRGDMYTRYNATTFLMLLMCTSEEGCQLAEKRVYKAFREAGPHRTPQLTFRKFPVFGIESVRENGGFLGNGTMNLCVNDYQNDDISGVVYHQYGKEPIKFQNFPHLLTVMNQLFDMVGYPQADTNVRTMGPELGQIYNIKGAPQAQTFADIQKHRGEILTVVFKVEHRLRSSWQGTMKFMETGSMHSFVSELQFLKHITNYLEWHSGENV